MDKVYLLYLQTTDRYMESGLQELTHFSDRVFPNVKQEVIVVDNDWTHDTEMKVLSNVNIISGDNSCREFSGLDKGWNWLNQEFLPQPDDGVIVANETFHRSYGKDYLNMFVPNLVRYDVAEGRLVGYTDAYPDFVELLGNSFKRWVRTSMLVASYNTMDKLFPMAFKESDKKFFLNEKQFFSNNAPMSDRYKRYLRTWLFGEIFEGSDFNEKWHSQKKLTKDNFEAFKNKAKGIFCEHFLSIRAKNKGIEIADVRRYQEVKQ